MSKSYKQVSTEIFNNIRNLYEAYDDVIATKMVIASYGRDMISEVESRDFRIMLWQVSHSLSYLEENTSFQIVCVEELEMIAYEAVYDEYLGICARHLLTALDNLKKYLAI